MKSERIALLIPYFGTLPNNYFPLFLKSLNLNPLLRVFIFTDIKSPLLSHSNITRIEMNYAELKELFENKLKKKPNLTNTRKLCEFKPLYGLIFEEYIKDYEFWAYGDLDLMFGDLQLHLPPILDSFDVITLHEYWISGPFTVLRNIPKMNNLFLLSADIEKIISNEGYLGFDECGNKFNYLLTGQSAINFKEDQEIGEDIECMTYLVNKMAQNGELRFYQKDKIKEFILYKERIDFKNGQLFFMDHELLIYHFITEKQYLRFQFPKWELAPESFYFLHTGAYKIGTSNFIVKLNFFYRVYLNEIYRFLGRMYLSFNYRVLKRTKKLKYRINVFK